MMTESMILVPAFAFPLAFGILGILRCYPAARWLFTAAAANRAIPKCNWIVRPAIAIAIAYLSPGGRASEL